jgi:hypothetical protein
VHTNLKPTEQKVRRRPKKKGFQEKGIDRHPHFVFVIPGGPYDELYVPFGMRQAFHLCFERRVYSEKVKRSCFIYRHDVQQEK